MRAGIAALDATLTLLIVGAIAAGAVCRIGWIGLGLIRLRSIRATAEPAPALAALAAALQRELGVTADIRLSDAVGSPATTGARRPIVLVPPRMIDLPPEVQRAVLCHELLHVRRRDWLPALIEEVWCALLWFHPSARALASRLGLARETLVDELAIAHTGDRRGYARALLEFSTDRPRLAGAAALIGRRHLEQRIALIAQEVPMPRASLVIRLAAAAVAVAVVTMAASSSVPLSATVQERIYKPSVDKGITVPKVIHEVKPTYTPEAMQARIQGSVFMTVVVLPSGDVGDVTVTESLDQEHGLDQQAVDATKQWKFEPGTLDGQAVAVEVVIQMTFTLKS
jgi:TonB family protein